MRVIGGCPSVFVEALVRGHRDALLRLLRSTGDGLDTEIISRTAAFSTCMQIWALICTKHAFGEAQTREYGNNNFTKMRSGV